jgi:CheY-like chemotaxis protein
MKTIMIVDDHANVRTLVKEYLAESSVSIAPTRRARRKPAAPGWDLQL